jgi:S1-C subfamily serine protease
MGVRLGGVARLGVGLADGDIVTSIDGTKTPDDDTATAVVLGAVGRGGRTVHATLVRGTEPINVVVELPDGDLVVPR